MSIQEFTCAACTVRYTSRVSLWGLSACLLVQELFPRATRVNSHCVASKRTLPPRTSPGNVQPTRAPPRAGLFGSVSRRESDPLARATLAPGRGDPREGTAKGPLPRILRTSGGELLGPHPRLGPRSSDCTVAQSRTSISRTSSGTAHTPSAGLHDLQIWRVNHAATRWSTSSMWRLRRGCNLAPWKREPRNKGRCTPLTSHRYARGYSGSVRQVCTSVSLPGPQC